MTQDRRTLDVLLLACAVGSGATFAWAAQEPALPDAPVFARGAALELVVPPPRTPAPNEDAAGARVLEKLPDGTPRLTLEWFIFPQYDAPDLRADPQPLASDAFPEAIRRFHGQEIAVEGYPLVLEYDGDRVREFLLTRFPPGCCFGAVPVFDEWVLVQLEEPRVGFPQDAATLTAVGRLDVGEVVDELGMADSLYRLQGSSLPGD
jgi:hypothetical protein